MSERSAGRRTVKQARPALPKLDGQIRVGRLTSSRDEPMLGQWTNVFIRRKLSAEESLLLAVFEDALWSYTRSNHATFREAARQWFSDEDAQGITSFNFICEHLLRAAPSRVRIAVLGTTSPCGKRPAERTLHTASLREGNTRGTG
ncbi:MAG: hypothetical protein ACE5JU_02090 [Candidatus Binatia bacterium]